MTGKQSSKNFWWAIKVFNTECMIKRKRNHQGYQTRHQENKSTSGFRYVQNCFPIYMSNHSQESQIWRQVKPIREQDSLILF